MSYISVPVPVRIKRYSGTNLFDIAARELGDSTQWYRIAEINLDVLGYPPNPWITQTVELKLPAAGASNGGIYGS
jgi:hypothetical protein